MVGKKGKTATPVNQELLLASVKEAEKDGPLKNLNVLWQVAADIYNAKCPEAPITFSIVLLRAKAWDIKTITVPGRRGKEKGVALSEEQKQAMQAGRKKKKNRSSDDPNLVLWAEGMKERLKENKADRFLNLVEITIKGSKRAKCKLQCLQCMAYQPQEVRQCGDYGCPLWFDRPYQKTLDEEPIEPEAPEAEAA